MDGAEAATQLYGRKGFGQVFPTCLKLPNPAEGKVEEIHSGFKFPRDNHCPQSLYDAQMAYFIDCVREGKTPVPGGLEGVINMKVIDAIYESSKTGTIVRIN